MDLNSLIWLILVAAVWGITTPLLRHNSVGIEKVAEKNLLRQWLAELLFLVKNWKFIVPLLINYGGSFIYTIALASSDLSLAVPLTNSLALIFVSISGRLLKEDDRDSVSYVGMTFVAAGVTLCVMEQTFK